MIEFKMTKIRQNALFALRPTGGLLPKEVTSILGAEYNAKTNVWYFPAYFPFGLEIYEQIHKLFKKELIIDETVYQHLQALQRTEAFLQKKEVDPRFKFVYPPLEHQLEGLVRAVTCNRLGLFWDCGLGKTKVATDIMRYLKRNTLYVCPARLVENTEDELHKHSFPKELSIHTILHYKKEKKIEKIEAAIADQAKVVVTIIGYESLPIYLEHFQNLRYDLLICDESHKLRTIGSKTSNAVLEVAAKAYRRIIMTGTPVLGNPLHLYEQIKVILPWLYKDAYAYRKKFVMTSPYNKHVTVGFKNLDILNRDIKQISIHRTKEECLDLPPRLIVKKQIGMSPSQMQLYQEVASGAHAAVQYNPIQLLIQMKLHQVCGGTLVESPIDYTICQGCPSLINCVEQKITPFTKHCVRKDIERPVSNILLEDNPKLDFLLELLETIVVYEKQKVIVWYTYQNEFEVISKALEQEGITYVDYSKQGQEAVRAFEDPSIQVFLAQVSSGAGITLNMASYTIFYSLTFDLLHYLQARDRNYRLGQKVKVTEFHLVMGGTIDELVQEALVNKQNVNEALLTKDLTSAKALAQIMIRR